MAGQAQHGIPRLSEAVISISRAPTSESVQVLRCMLQGQLGEALASTGQYAEARTACEAALAVAEGLDDLRAQGLGEGQLGAVALAEGKTEEALTRFRAASALFQRIGEFDLEALSRHQLGQICHQQREWDEADRHYREAARLRELAGDPAGAAQLWSQLALLCQQAGRPEQAGTAYRKAIGCDQESDNLEDNDASRPDIEITLHETVTTKYVFEPDLLLDDAPQHRIRTLAPPIEPLAGQLHAMLLPCTRVYLDEGGVVRIALPEGEPSAERRPGCTVLRRLRREVAVSGGGWPDLAVDQEDGRVIHCIRDRGRPAGKRRSPVGRASGCRGH